MPLCSIEGGTLTGALCETFDPRSAPEQKQYSNLRVGHRDGWSSREARLERLVSLQERIDLDCEALVDLRLDHLWT